MQNVLLPLIAPYFARTGLTTRINHISMLHVCQIMASRNLTPKKKLTIVESKLHTSSTIPWMLFDNPLHSWGNFLHDTGTPDSNWILCIWQYLLTSSNEWFGTWKRIFAEPMKLVGMILEDRLYFLHAGYWHDSPFWTHTIDDYCLLL